jgi:hypothetical protein
VKDTGEVVSEAAEKVGSEAAVSVEVSAEASEATDLTIITTSKYRKKFISIAKRKKFFFPEINLNKFFSIFLLSNFSFDL